MCRLSKFLLFYYTQLLYDKIIPLFNFSYNYIHYSTKTLGTCTCSFLYNFLQICDKIDSNIMCKYHTYNIRNHTVLWQILYLQASLLLVSSSTSFLNTCATWLSGNVTKTLCPLSANLLICGSIGTLARNGTFTISERAIPPPEENILVHSCKNYMNYISKQFYWIPS